MMTMKFGSSNRHDQQAITTKTEQYFYLRVKTDAVTGSGRPPGILVDVHVYVTFGFKQALEMFLIK